MSNKWKQRVFEGIFWVFVGMSVAVTVAILYLGWWLYTEEAFRELELMGHASVALATVALALFTCFLWLAAAISARFARKEITTSTAVNSANLTLQLDNRFNSDRALRIRHGAVMFLVKKRHLEEEVTCDYDISPYSTEQKPWNDLSSDLIDLFNFFDWIGYLTSEESKAIELDVVHRRIGTGIINLYQICEDEIEKARKEYPPRWRYLPELYNNLKEKEKKDYKRDNKVYPGNRTDEELDAWLLREHVRSHRGAAGGEARPEAMHAR